ncbi:MAG: hypothetical protein RLZZ330_1170 [Actinomycetota bacterium]
MPSNDVVYDFITSVVLDVEVSNKTTSESLAISQGLSDLQVLAIARSESFRQLRARNVFAFDIPTISIDSDPVQGLTLMERAVLSLSLRQKLSDKETSEVVDENIRDVVSSIRSARKNLARTAIALTLMNNNSKCPVIEAAHKTLGTKLTRAQVMHLVTHSAECSICVNVLRVVDKQVIEDYINAAQLKYPNDLPEISEVDKAKLVNRADLRNGWPMKVGKFSTSPKKLVRNALFLGAVSSVLLILGLVLLNS